MISEYADMSRQEILDDLIVSEKRNQKLEETLNAIKYHWYECVPPFTMPFLNFEREALLRYIQDMTEWGRQLSELLGGYSQFIEKGDSDG